tara:strand:- start:68 stop:844 length:777 start_codon:yes stop_codon:yes gene_type:complete
MSKGSDLLKSRWLSRKGNKSEKDKSEKLLLSMDSLLQLSRHSILSKLNGSKSFTEYVEEQKQKEWNDVDFESIEKIWKNEKMGVRVSIFINNELRGCSGLLKSSKNVYEDIIEHSINAGFSDERFPPLTWKDFKRIELEVSLIDEEEVLIEYKDPIELCMILDRQKDSGVLIRHPKGRQAYYLPDTWDLIPDPAMLLSSLCVNAGLPSASWRGEKRLWPRKIKEKKRDLYTGKIIEPEEFSGVSIYSLNVKTTCGKGK